MIQEVLSLKKRRSDRQIPSLQASPPALNRILDNPDPVPSALKLRFKIIFDRYEGLIKKCSTNYTATKWKVRIHTVFFPSPKFLHEANLYHVRTFSPLELVVTAVLIAVHHEHRTDNQLIDDIKAMRTYLRMQQKDLRVNTVCWATSWHFITEIMDRRRGVKPGTVTFTTTKSSQVKLMQAIEGHGNPAVRDIPRNTRHEFSDGESPLSSAGATDDDDDNGDETSTSTPDSSLSDEDQDPLPPTRRRTVLGKRKLTTSKRQKVSTSSTRPPAKRRKLASASASRSGAVSARKAVANKTKTKGKAKTSARMSARTTMVSRAKVKMRLSRVQRESEEVSFDQLDR